MNTKKRETINVPGGIDSLPKPLQDFIYQALEENRALRERIAELERRLARNSSNSNNPPSTDRFVKKSKPKSERIISGKKPGGQPGHKGTTLRPTDNPDETKYYDVMQCESCECDISATKPIGFVARQECDIPPIQPRIIEHRMISKQCSNCKKKTTAQGPKELTQPIQYGSRIKAFAGYFHYYQLLPVKRSQEMFSDLFSLSISQGTLVNMYEKLYIQLALPE